MPQSDIAQSEEVVEAQHEDGCEAAEEDAKDANDNADEEDAKMDTEESPEAKGMYILFSSH